MRAFLFVFFLISCRIPAILVLVGNERVHFGVNHFVNGIILDLEDLILRIRAIGDRLVGIKYTSDIQADLEVFYSSMDDFLAKSEEVGYDILYYESIRRGVLIPVILLTLIVFMLAIIPGWFRIGKLFF